jgi:hypothetical protein
MLRFSKEFIHEIFVSVVEIESRASHMLGKHFTTEQQLQSEVLKTVLSLSFLQ